MWYKMIQEKDPWNFKPACGASHLRRWIWNGVILGGEVGAWEGILKARFYKTGDINEEAEVNIHKYTTYYAYVSLC